MTAFALGLLGLVLSLVVPAALSSRPGARWTAVTPTASVLLWQSVVLASVLSAVGVVLIAPEELTSALRAGPDVQVWGLAGALSVAVLIVVRLVVSLVGVMRRSAARRDRHRELVDLLSDDDDEQLRVLHAALPLAYGLPGRRSRLVISDGALALLSPEQVRSVLVHEQTHLRARHDVVLEGFTAFHRAVPRPLRNEAALGAVELMLEAAADDSARRRCGPEAVRGALELLGGAVDPAAVGPLAAAGAEGALHDDDLTSAHRRFRVERLDLPTGGRARAGAVVVLACGVLVLPTAVLVVPWLAGALAVAPLP